MKNIIEDLKKSPLFNLSLASKELFHSNFWAWFFENNEKITVDFFSDLTKKELNQLVSVKRENRNIDLQLEFDSNFIVAIENKIKSIPNEEQLVKYTKKIGTENSLFLLSIYRPDNFESYNYISYEDLLRLLENFVGSTYCSALFKDYTEFIKNLLSLTESWENMNVFDFHTKFKNGENQNNYSLYKEIRLHDLYHKVKYNQLKTMLFEKTYNSLSGEYRSNLKPFEYFSNATGASSLLYYFHKDMNLELQIQDNMFRFMIISHKNSIYPKADIIADNNHIKNIYKLFETDYINGITEDAIYPKNRSFNKFGSNLIYRYKNLKCAEINQMVELSSKFFIEVINIVETNKNEIINLIKN